MNMKDLVVPIGLAVISMLALNYFFPNKTSTHVAESSFIAPKEKKEYKPLNVEVDFYDQESAGVLQITNCETEWAHLTFSTDGASLNSLDFKRKSDGQEQLIRTVFPVLSTERSEKAMLVGLQQATPYGYTLLSSDESENIHSLVYIGSNDSCVIQKIFFVHKNIPQIDLAIEVMPKNNNHDAIEPRIFFPAPRVEDLKGSDVTSSIVIDQSGVFAKNNVGSLNIQKGWFNPSLFGSDNRYFIHAMINDEDSFTQRAYYKLEEHNQLFSVLEGPTVTEKASWKLSFYFGSKDLDSIAAIDERLEKTLDYSGVLSFLAKLMLYVLNWFYSFLHNYGLAIIALTLLIQILLLPLSLRNSEEKFKKQQMDYQRELAFIEQRFAGNPEKLLAERTELIRKKGLPGFGCLLPLLIQVPIFFALSRVLSSSFELYKAPFLWIPDLSLKDPYYILPLLTILIMLISDMKGDPQQRMSKIAMAFVFGFFTASFSAGLALYIFMGRLLTVIQARIMNYCKLV